MTFPLRLRAARQRAGLTQQQAAAALGVSASAYCGYETGKRQPDLDRLARLCLLFSVPADELLGLPAAPPVSPAEEEHLARLRSLDAHGRRMVRLVLAEECARMAPAAGQGRLLPFRVSEQPAAAGMGAYLGPEAFRCVLVAEGRLPRGASFGVPVRGDSMEPAYHDRDVLVVSDALPEPGDVGVFIMDGAGYVKVCGRGELLSLNPAYAPIPMTEGIRPCGKVIGVLREDELLA